MNGDADIGGLSAHRRGGLCSPTAQDVCQRLAASWSIQSHQIMHFRQTSYRWQTGCASRNSPSSGGQKESKSTARCRANLAPRVLPKVITQVQTHTPPHPEYGTLSRAQPSGRARTVRDPAARSAARTGRPHFDLSRRGAPQSERETQARKYMAQGLKAQKEDDFVAARSAYLKSFETYPSYDVAGNLGMVEVELMQYSDAANTLAY